MINTLILIDTIFNTVMIMGIILFYFFSNFIILDINTYNALAEAYNAQQEQEQETEEKAGGVGFQIYDQVEGLEEEEGE